MIRRHRIAVLASAGILAIAGAATAAAHPGAAGPPDPPPSAVARDGGERPGPQHGRGRHCEVAPERLLAAAEHPALARLAAGLAEAVAEGRLTQAKADRIFAHVQLRITLKVARQSARLAPVLALFGVADRDALREAIEEAGGLRALAEQKEIDRAELRAARREGRAAARAALRELCESHAEDEPATPTPEPPAEPPAEPDAPAA